MSNRRSQLRLVNLFIVVSDRKLSTSAGMLRAAAVGLALGLLAVPVASQKTVLRFVDAPKEVKPVYRPPAT
jgi:hypothetical protein